MPDLKSLRDAANAWAAQEAQDIASGAKKVPPRVNTMPDKDLAAPKGSLEKHPLEAANPRDPGRLAARAKRAFSDLTSHDHPAETDLHEEAPEAQVEHITDTGEAAGATTAGPKFGGTRPSGFENRAPKDLGRVTTKVLKGEYGSISPKTAGQVKGSFLGRAAESVAGKVGSTLGAYGTASLAMKAASAYQGMKQGQAVNPLTLDTSPIQRGKKYLTVSGEKTGEELGAGEQM